jgi:hypothetical protein
MEVATRKLEVKLYGPAGEQVNGNTLISTVRRFASVPTADDKKRRATMDIRVAEVKDVALIDLSDAEVGQMDTEHVVCRGYLLALVEQYGRKHVREMFDDL